MAENWTKFDENVWEASPNAVSAANFVFLTDWKTKKAALDSHLNIHIWPEIGTNQSTESFLFHLQQLNIIWRNFIGSKCSTSLTNFLIRHQRWPPLYLIS